MFSPINLRRSGPGVIGGPASSQPVGHKRNRYQPLLGGQQQVEHDTTDPRRCGRRPSGPEREPADGEHPRRTADFVTRAEFTSAYPLSFTSAQYVDKLNTNTGNSLTPSERDAFVNGLENSGHTRATVLRAVVDNAVFRQKELKNAFVLMEYFGYLRRDIDVGGYAFWLNVLNNTNNSPGMVCAFINSAEYQLRFSPVVTRNDNICAAIAP